MTKRYRPGLPGGRAKYLGPDNYAAQTREYESRIDQAPGYVKAVLQNNLTTAAGATTTVVWQTTTLSNFVPAMQHFGWDYNSTTGQFFCRRPGLYQVSFGGRITDSIGAPDQFVFQFRVVRGINSYLFLVVSGASTLNVTLSAVTDFDFQRDDILSFEYVNATAGNRTLSGFTGAGTTLETESPTFLNLWQIG